MASVVRSALSSAILAYLILLCVVMADRQGRWWPLRWCEASTSAPSKCGRSQVTATGFHHLRYVSPHALLNVGSRTIVMQLAEADATRIVRVTAVQSGEEARAGSSSILVLQHSASRSGSARNAPRFSACWSYASQSCIMVFSSIAATICTWLSP